MSTNLLEEAITQIHQGNMLEAQKMLEDMLSADPRNLTAWSWYVKTYPPGEKRIKALRLCLQYNPENEQAKKALKKLKEPTILASTAKPTNIGCWYGGMIGIFLIEVASVFLLSALHLGTGSLILIIPAMILAFIQLLIIGAIAPIYMLFKLVQSKNKPAKITAEETEKQKDGIAGSIDQQKKWPTIIGIVGTGILAVAIFLFLRARNENLTLPSHQESDQFLQYTLIFWFLIGANFAAMIIAVFKRASTMIKKSK